MIPISVPADARRVRADCTLVNMGPPAGVSDDDCGTAQMLVGPSARITGADWSRPNYVYYRPSPDELDQLRAGGFIEFAQYGPTVQPFSATVWPANNMPKVDHETVRCALCLQSQTFTGEDFAELAQMWLEDGGHYCVDIGDEP